MTANYENTIAAFNQYRERIVAQIDSLQETKASGFNTINCSVCDARGRFMKKTSDGTIICKECERTIRHAIKRSAPGWIDDERPTDEELASAENTKAQYMLMNCGAICCCAEYLLRFSVHSAIENRAPSSVVVLCAATPCDCCANAKGFDVMSNTWPVPVGATQSEGRRVHLKTVNQYLNVCEHCVKRAGDSEWRFTPFSFIPDAERRAYDNFRANQQN